MKTDTAGQAVEPRAKVTDSGRLIESVHSCYESRLLVQTVLMFDPAGLVIPPGVLVGPVNDSTTIIPLIFAIERDRVTFAKSRNSRRKIDIVGDQEGSSCTNLYDESLMAASVVVIRQYPNDPTAAPNLLSALPLAG